MTGFAAVNVADEAQHDHRCWAGIARVVGPVWTQLPSLTVGLFGVQVLWSVEMSYASPYLLSLGLPKSHMAIVFLAGPLSGLIVQPIIGILADNSKSRFGRRRPFILVSTALCAFATLLLGFTRPFASLFTTMNSSSNDALTVWLAILSIYCIDFSINAVQALDRALLVDTLPTAKQPAGNAWAARMLTMGSVAGFFAGNIDLPHFFPLFGSSQLEVLSVITALLLFLTHVWMCVHVRERVLLVSSNGPRGFREELKELWETLVRLPRVIRQICWIQFFAWLGWFPVLFYSTVYIGDLHKASSPIPETQDAAIALDAESTRLGTRALFYSALVSLVANIVMPWLVVAHGRHASSPLEPKRKRWLERVGIDLASLWAYSHLIFSGCMAATFITSTVLGATWIIFITGFCWAVALWVPSALLGEAILSHPTSDDAGSIHLADVRSTRVGRTRERGAEEETRRLFDADGNEEGGEEESDDGPLTSRREGEWEGLTNASTSGPAGKSGDGLSAQAGTILGIHNLFVVVPQFLVTGLSSIVFALLDPDKSVLPGHRAGKSPTQPQPTGDGSGTILSMLQHAVRSVAGADGEQKTNSIAIIFRLGGISAAIAFVLSYRLAKELKPH